MVDINICLTNIVLSSSIDTKLNLHDIAKNVINVIYKPKIFSGLILRHRKIRGTCLVFSNGKLITNGCSSMEEATRSTRQFARFLQKYNNQGELRHSIKIVTISALARTYGKLNLRKMVQYCGADYEPERFNAATLKKSGMHFSIFSSGNIVITGAKSVDQIYEEGKECVDGFKSENTRNNVEETALASKGS